MDGMGIVRNYRKKPVVIQATQIDLDKLHRTPQEFKDELCRCSAIGNGHEAAPDRMIYPVHVHTIEQGAVRVRDGDWVIKGVKGEFYPCDPEVFDMTYETVEP